MNIDKKEKFSIRKTTMGVGSLLLATTLFVSDVDRILLSHLGNESTHAFAATIDSSATAEVLGLEIDENSRGNKEVVVEYHVDVSDWDDVKGNKLELPAPYITLEKDGDAKNYYLEYGNSFNVKGEAYDSWDNGRK